MRSAPSSVTPVFSHRSWPRLVGSSAAGRSCSGSAGDRQVRRRIRSPLQRALQIAEQAVHSQLMHYQQIVSGPGLCLGRPPAPRPVPRAPCSAPCSAHASGGPRPRGLARSKTTSRDWYASRKAPIGGFHAHIQGCGGVRTRLMTRGSAYQSVHVDLGKTWPTDLIDGICDPANGQRVLLWSSSLTRVLGWAHDDATPPRSVWLTTVDETGT